MFFVLYSYSFVGLFVLNITQYKCPVVCVMLSTVKE